MCKCARARTCTRVPARARARAMHALAPVHRLANGPPRHISHSAYQLILLSLGVNGSAAAAMEGQWGTKWAESSAILEYARALYRLYVGIADGMSVARVWACRYSK